MAITSTNSNTVSIGTLPKSQLAVGSDLFLLQTTNGTQVISFDNLNVIKTDVNGNATVIGDLSGNNAYLSTAILNSVTAANFQTTAGPGITLANDFYNKFTIQNGLVLSASYNIQNDPVYLQLYSTDVPNLVNSLTTNYKRVVDAYNYITIPAGSTAVTVNIDSFFATNNYITLGLIQPTNFTLTTDFIPTTASIALSASITPQSLAILSSLSALSGSLATAGDTPTKDPNLNNYGILTSTGAIALFTQSTNNGADGNGFVINVTPTTITIPSIVQPLITPTSIAYGLSQSGNQDALTFEINIGVPQSVDVKVYWRLLVTAP
jgi:hypothetical protein